jgi:hypothetical protein
MFRSLTIATAMLALVVATPASAQEPPPLQSTTAVQGSGEGIAPSAPEAVRQRIRAVLTGAEGMRTTQSARRTSWIGCRTIYAYRGYSNPIGMSLFRYYQQVSWCSNGFGIYSWSRERWPEISGVGWRFDGHIGSSLGGSSTQKNAWTQGSFTGCIGFCQTRVPWISLSVRVDGGWSWNTGD